MTKAEKIYPELKKMITELSPGSRIPSVRVMMKKFHVSQSTIDQAMGKFKDEGLVVTYVGDGTYTKGYNEKKESLMIGVAVSNYPSPLAINLIRKTEEEIAKAGHSSKIIRYDWREPLSASIDAKPLDALMLSPDALFSAQDFFYINKLKIPTVILGFRLKGIDIDTVGSDNEYGGALVADCFIKSNHKKMAILLAEPDNVIFQSRREGFIKHARLSGIDEVELINTNTQSGEDAFAKAYSVMSDIFKSNNFDFNALFVLSDGSALGALKAAHDNALRLPDDLSLIGYDDIPEAEYYFPALSTVRQNLSEWGKEAVKIIIKRLAGHNGSSTQKIVFPEIILRDTTAPDTSFNVTKEISNEEAQIKVV